MQPAKEILAAHKQIEKEDEKALTQAGYSLKKFAITFYMLELVH